MTRETFLPYARQKIEEDDIRAVNEVLRSDFITTGPKVIEFEEFFSDVVEAEYAVSFSSGTAALHGAIYAANIAKDDEVVTSPLSFCATSNCVLYQGGRPLFADVSYDTLNLNPNEVADLVSTRTKAILAVDYGGHPADLDSLAQIAEDSNLLLIEDACHALGAKYKGKPIGGISDMTIFSFHPVKHITTGEGGMVTTNDCDLARRLTLFRNHGIGLDFRQRNLIRTWKYEMTDLGYNYRLTDIASALGISQLRKLPENLKRRREIAAIYNNAFQKIPGLVLPKERSNSISSWHLYPVRFDFNIIKSSQSRIYSDMHAENIGVNVHYIPIYEHPYYKNLGYYKKCSVADAAYKSIVSLPMFHGMTDFDAADVIETLKNVI